MCEILEKMLRKITCKRENRKDPFQFDVDSWRDGRVVKCYEISSFPLEFYFDGGRVLKCLFEGGRVFEAVFEYGFFEYEYFSGFFYILAVLVFFMDF